MPWRLSEGEIYCRACVEDMPAHIWADTDEAPEHVQIEEPERPVRCASAEDCVHAVDLTPYGYAGEDEQSPCVGALVSLGLAASGLEAFYSRDGGSAFERALFALELEELDP